MSSSRENAAEDDEGAAIEAGREYMRRLAALSTRGTLHFAAAARRLRERGAPVTLLSLSTQVDADFEASQRAVVLEAVWNAYERSMKLAVRQGLADWFTRQELRVDSRELHLTENTDGNVDGMLRARHDAEAYVYGGPAAAALCARGGVHSSTVGGVFDDESTEGEEEADSVKS